MDRATLTASYLDAVKASRARASELVGDLPQLPELLLNAFSPGARYLSRPEFVGRDEISRLHADVELVRQALFSLPARLFGGDVAAFARAAGAEGYQADAIARSVSSPVSPQGRADLYEDASGFRLLEFNMGSALGGMENAELARTMLRHPLLAAFAREHRLGYVDTMREQVANMMSAAGVKPGARPVVAVTDWPSSYRGHLGPYMGKLAARWADYGLEAHPCHIGELEVRGGRVWLRGHAIDIVSRMFLLEYLLEPGAAELMDPVLGAVERREVAMFTTLESEVYGSKAALAMLSDPANRPVMRPEELAAIDRLLPWTVMVRPGPVTLPGGQRADLLGYATREQAELVLKPALRYGGQDVLPGWTAGLTGEAWRQALEKAMDGPFVLQRRVRPVTELFPGEDGEQVPWIVAWGVYTGVNGYGGVIMRGVTVDSGAVVLNAAVGAHLGCCLHADPEGA